MPMTVQEILDDKVGQGGRTVGVAPSAPVRVRVSRRKVVAQVLPGGTGRPAEGSSAASWRGQYNQALQFPPPRHDGGSMSHAAEPQASQGLPIADPTPIGLICLAIGCAALVPIAFGAGLTPSGLKTAAMFCLLFGAGGQAIAGLGNLLRKNLYGATLFTSFAFNWVMNWWIFDGLSRGQMVDPTIVLGGEYQVAHREGLAMET